MNFIGFTKDVTHRFTKGPLRGRGLTSGGHLLSSSWTIAGEEMVILQLGHDDPLNLKPLNKMGLRYKTFSKRFETGVVPLLNYSSEISWGLDKRTMLFKTEQ